MRRTTSNYLEEPEPERLIEVLIVYQNNETETHLVLAPNELKAVSLLEKKWEAKGPVAGMKCTPCDRYTSVVIGHRKYDGI